MSQKGSNGLVKITEYISYKVNNNKLLIYADLKEDAFRPSKSGKTDVNTVGRAKEIILPDGSSVFLNMSVYKYTNPKKSNSLFFSFFFCFQKFEVIKNVVNVVEGRSFMV